MIEGLFVGLIFLILIWLAVYVVPSWVGTVMYAVAAIASLYVLLRLFQRVGGGVAI